MSIATSATTTASASNPSEIADLGPLAWVLGEIRTSLETTSKSLHRFARERNAPEADVGLLRIVRQQLHQAVGALQMVGHTSPALVLGAMEFAVQGFVQEPRRCTEEAVGKIERAGFAVCDFLQALLVGKRVSSVALFPQYREVLQVAGNALANPADLWTTSAWRWAEVKLPDNGGGKPSKFSYDASVRAKFDREVLKLIKTGEEKAAQRLHALCVGLSRGSMVPRISSFWALAGGFFEAIASSLLAVDVYVKREVSRVLLQYISLARGDNSVSERLGQELLFFSAQTAPAGRDAVPTLRAVRAAWGIADERPVDYNTEQFGLFDPLVLAQVRKRVEAAKETWTVLSAGDLGRVRQAVDAFAQLTEVLQKLHPSSQPLAQALNGAVEASMQSSKAPGTELAMEVATAVLYLEATFEDLDPNDRQLTARMGQLAGRIERARGGGQSEPLEPWMEDLYRRVSDRHTMGTVVDELRSHLGELEKVMDQFFRRPTEKKLLANVPTQLMQMRGVFSVLGLDQAVQAVLRMREQVEQLMATEAAVEASSTFDSLGNNLGALGFLIDMLSYQPVLAKRVFVFDPEAGELKPLMGRYTSDDLVAEEKLSPEQVDAQIANQLAALGTGTPVRTTGSAVEEFSRAAADWTAQITGPAPLEALPHTLVTELEEDDLQNIFLDEAREVIQNGLSAIGVLSRHTDDVGELTVLRRAFHTLKGSSRMVGLSEFGDAAWAMEQVLNTWLADQHAATPALLTGAGQALRDFADWIEAIAANQPHAWHVQPFRDLAEALRSGEAPSKGPSAADVEALVVAARHMAAEEASALGVGTVNAGAAAAFAEMSASVPETLAVPKPESYDMDFRATNYDDLQGLEPAAPVAPLLDENEHFDFPATDFLDFGDAPSSEPAPPPMVDETMDLLGARSVPQPAQLAQPDEPAYAPTVMTAPLDLVAAAPRPQGSAQEQAPAPETTRAVDAVPAIEAEPVVDDAVKVIGPLRIGIALYNVYLNEADEWSRQLATQVGEWALDPSGPVADQSIAFAHSLAGSSATVGFEGLSGMARLLEHALQHLQVLGSGSPEQAATVLNATEEIRRLLHQFAAGFLKEPSEAILQSLRDLAMALPAAIAHTAAPAPDVASRAPMPFMLPAQVLVTPARSEASAPVPEIPAFKVAEPASSLPVNDDAPVVQSMEMAEEVASELPPQAPEPAEDPAMDAVELDASFELAEPMEVQAQTVEDFSAAEIPAITASAESPASPALPMPSVEPAVVAVEAMAGSGDVRLEDSEESADIVDAVDPDLFPIFEEEAQELLPGLDEALRGWLEQPQDIAPRATILRALHTLKGSARLAGAMRLGERAHHMESAVEAINEATLNRGAIEALMTRYDALREGFDHLRQVDDAVQQEIAQHAVDATVQHPSVQMSEPQAVPESVSVSPELMEPPVTILPAAKVFQSMAQPSPATLAQLRPVHSQAVRVRTHLLDRLVTQAGEVIITRSRLEAELVQLHGALNELTGNLDRLRQQLRDIEVQAESQMQSRLAQAKDSQQSFDPLEFDRFTRVQELTRMMAESVNDVATVQRALQKTVQASEDSLSAQARQTRELQRGLLRTRMVEFEGISDRLYRVVRQASKDTGKSVRLDIVGGAMEMDRSILDRMTPAFEHLLRNCVAHGIEDAAAREAAGKDATGHVVVEVHQEGNDVAVTFSDDGGGLNVARIAERARALGLVGAGEEVSIQKCAELIMQPGFTTVEKVSELAGRGVGMDVVRTELAALGGYMQTQSTQGLGTRFKLMLPLTTAVTHVVMVRAGEQLFGVPSNLVELVQRVSAGDLEQAYAQQRHAFGGESVPFFWAGALLQASAHSERAPGRVNTVMVVRSAAQRVALHVDEVLGNQEVVVKNLGPQLARLPGMAGISLLPSGAVALIYNPVALAAVHGEQVRQMQQFAAVPAPAGHAVAVADSGDVVITRPPRVSQVPLVLVVDDSITVRRVTQRLLQREGYRVVLAADGLQALERLQEERPTLVLSDIEMPRMDGFDLARNIRADAELADLPIIMITSRIAEKHREHAKQLGVNHYLGKPYSEEELLRLVRSYALEGQAIDG